MLSSDLNLARLLHVLICAGREFHDFGAAYLNDLAANVLCLIFGNSSTGGSHLSHTVVKPDYCLGQISFAKFLCIIKLIIIG